MRNLIKKILKEQEDDLEWAEDIVNNTHPYYGLPKNDDYVLFYFFPFIKGVELNQYVIPKLMHHNIMTDESDDFVIIDHLELHIDPKIDGKIEGFYGDVGYFGCDNPKCFIDELSKEGEIPINGREYFQIP